MSEILTIWVIIVLLAIWDAIWKGIGLWKSAGHKQLAWFVAMFIINSAGILPIIYIYFFQKKRRLK